MHKPRSKKKNAPGRVNAPIGEIAPTSETASIGETAHTSEPASIDETALTGETAPIEGMTLVRRHSVTLCYVFAVMVHLILLSFVYEVPHTFPDEIHYSVTGENIRWGNGYRMRGQFSTSAPPLQPLFIALTHALGGPYARTVAFISAVCIMCLAIFPATKLAVRFGLSHRESLLYGLIVGFLPHTAYAATYMSEDLQYPLFFFSLYIAIGWVERPTVKESLKLGALLALMALARYATGTYVAVLAAVALYFAVIHRRLAGTRQRLGQLALVVGMYAAAQGGWWLYKVMHGGSVLGAYKNAYDQLPFLTWRLFLAYIGDAFMAAGPFTLAPFVVGCAFLWRNDRPAGLLAVSLCSVFVVTTAVFDGGITGLVRERLYLYVIPLLSLVAFVGLTQMCARRRPGLALAGSVLAAAACVCLALLHPFQSAPMGETPWAHLLGTARINTLAAPYDLSHMTINSLIISVVAAAALWRFRSHARLVFLYLILGLNVLAFGVLASSMSIMTADARKQLGPALNTLSANVLPGAKIAIAGVRHGFGAAEISAFGELNEQRGLDYVSICRLEIMKGLDVHIISDVGELKSPALSNAPFLATVRFPSLPLIASESGYYLHRMPEVTRSAESGFEEPVFIPASAFASQIGRRTSTGSIVGQGTKRHGFLAYGPYRVFQPGTYRVSFLVSGSVPITVDVNENTKDTGHPLVSLAGLPSNIGSQTFTNTGAGNLEFRVFGPDRGDFKFDGVRIAKQKPEWFSRYEVDVPFSRFATEVGVAQESRAIAGDGSMRTGFLVFGPYISLPRGHYRVSIPFEAPPNETFQSDVTVGGAPVCSAQITAASALVCDFDSDGGRLVEFRIHGRSSSNFRFRGAKLSIAAGK